ncbi:MAG: hypothetical protein L0Z50_09800 [Verrucomicrobiales bacterium]|nr:hypothetical protein [Verrucomicrobiales bacterium]
MKAPSLSPDHGIDSPAPIKSAIAICVVYDDDLARDRAQRVGPHLLRELGALLEVSFSWWKSKFFYHPRILQMASDAAARADIILFSWHSGNHLPLVITDWLNTALARRDESEVVLVSLLGTGVPASLQSSPAVACLSQIARKASMDFLSYADPVLAGWSDPDVPTTAGRAILIEK